MHNGTQSAHAGLTRFGMRSCRGGELQRGEEQVFHADASTSTGGLDCFPLLHGDVGADPHHPGRDRTGEGNGSLAALLVLVHRDSS
jgi:hypothetical protein